MRLRALISLGALLVVLTLTVKIRHYVLQDFVYAGSDSYAYLGAAAELAENHRFANRPPPWYPNPNPPGQLTPLSYGRLPGYPLLLATLLKQPVREYKDFLPVFERLKPVQLGVDLLTCTMAFFGAHLLGGLLAAVAASLLVATNPFLMLFQASVLTETLATFFSTAALFCLIAAVFQKKRWWWLLGGVVIAMGMMVRIDTIMLVPCLLLPALWPQSVGAENRRAGLGITAGALLALGIVFSPWPVRNLMQFGHPHPLGGQCDVQGREMPHIAFFGWFATWLEKESDTPNTLFCFFHDDCISQIALYPPHAFDSADERQRVEQLFQLRAVEGLSARVDDGFRTITRERLRRHPLRSLITLPLVRAYHQWIEPADQPLRSSTIPVRLLTERQVEFPRISKITAQWGLLGLLFLWLRKRTRAAALLLTVALLTRTAALALIGFVENRYLLELLPATFMLCAVALAAPFQVLMWIGIQIWNRAAHRQKNRPLL